VSPQRTCIGCRHLDEQSALVRHVQVDGVLTRDERRRLPGRGCWLHPDPACAALALRRKAFARALRTTVSVPSGLFDGA